MSTVFQFNLKTAFRIAFLVVIATLGTASYPLSHLAKREFSTQVITQCTKPNVAALTFDDGPSQYLKVVSKALTDVGGKGTFFFNGKNWVDIYEAGPSGNVLYAYQQGHQIASHTWGHLDLTELTRDKVVDEFQKTDDAIKSITGVRPAFMRPPYGKWNENVKSVAQERGQHIVLWDMDSEDSVGASADRSKRLFDDLAERHPKNVLALMHDTLDLTAHVVAVHAIQVLSKAGYRLVTVAECVGLQPYQ